ncbi:MAG: SAM-dependent methyltransferase [Ginsengibacter sp.]
MKIKRDGPLSFCDFMDMALYNPSVGYYNSDTDKIGKDGDYYTSPVLCSLFGKMIGKQLEEMWMLLDKKPFTIVEYGAGTAAMCFDILAYLKNNIALYDGLSYCIIERSSKMQEQQKKYLHQKVTWYHSLNELPQVNGCILSNEVLDNFPVHKVIMKSELMEVFVSFENDFVEILQPANEKLKDYFDEQNITLPRDYCTEVNLEALDWTREIAINLHSGFALTIDYGFPINDLCSSKRSSGTLMCYKDHHLNNSPFSNIGKQDITAHVNFSALVLWGKKYGLELTGFSTQGNFLRSLSLMNHLRELESEHLQKNENLILQIHQLLTEMGNKFRVLIQQKKVKSKMFTGLLLADSI